jgi:hypothetical protein
VVKLANCNVPRASRGRNQLVGYRCISRPLITFISRSTCDVCHDPDALRFRCLAGAYEHAKLGRVQELSARPRYHYENELSLVFSSRGSHRTCSAPRSRLSDRSYRFSSRSHGKLRLFPRKACMMASFSARKFVTEACGVLLSSAYRSSRPLCWVGRLGWSRF